MDGIGERYVFPSFNPGSGMSQTPPQQTKRKGQGPFVIWHGMNLSSMARFLARRPHMHWSRAHRIALMPAMGLHNSLMSLAETALYGRAVQNTEIKHAPVFILGYWRSGTTLLHNLITRDPQFTFPNTYQMLFPTHFLLTERISKRLTAPLMPPTRPMDNVRCGWDLPQEDEFALCTLTLLSPYLLTSHADDYSVYKPLFDFAGVPEADVRRWCDALQLLVRKITYKTPRPVVLKSPAHTYRIPLLLRMFPNAKFVYIHRHPYNVFRSCVYMRQTMVRENELGRSALKGHEEEVLRTYKHAFACYERDRKLIPAGNLHEVSFERLEADPLQELQSAYSGLNLDGFGELREALLPELAAMKQYKKNRFDEDREWKSAVHNELRPAFERFGYDADAGSDAESSRTAA